MLSNLKLSNLKLNISAKLILVALLCIIPSLILAGFILASQQRELLINTLNTSLDNTLSFAQDAIHQDLYYLQNTAKSIATDTKLRRALDTGSGRGTNSRLNVIAKSQPELDYILLIDEEKTVFSASTSNFSEKIVGAESLLGSSIILHPFYSELPQKSSRISSPGKDPFLSNIGLSNNYSQWIIAPVSVRGVTRGWVILSFRFEETLSKFLQRLIDRLQVLGYPALFSSIVDAQGKDLAVSETYSSSGLSRETVLTLGGTDFQLAIEFDSEKVLAPLKKQQTTIVLAFLLLSLVLGLTLFLAVNFILIKPVRHLDKAALRFSNGDLEYRIRVSGEDELSLLARTFNDMAKQILLTHISLETKIALRTKELAEVAYQLEIKNKSLERYTHELERSNNELNDFAYVASHDLKAPLRAITQLSDWIEEDLSGELETQTKEYLSLMKNRIARLEQLLDDLLAYSRVGRKHGDFNLVNVKELTENIFHMLNPPPGFILVADDDLPTFLSLSVPLEQILRNLINNSIKHHDLDSGTITVSVASTGTGFDFVVSDNGPGIAPEQNERIFGIFQTLKPRDEVEGSGMGLAIIKKLLDTYHCTIEVQSDGVRGTDMCFTWPAEKQLRQLIDG